MTRYRMPTRVVSFLLIPLLLHAVRGEDIHDSPQRVANSWLVSQLEPAEANGEGEGKKPRVQVRELLANLNFPGSLTIQPETGRIHFVENGSGRIRRLTNDAQAADVLQGLPRQQDPQQPDRIVAEYHLAFLDQNHLIIGTGPRSPEVWPEPGQQEPTQVEANEAPPDDETQEGWLRLFRLSGDDKPLSVDPLSPQQALPVTEQSLASRKLKGLLATPSALFVISRRENSAPWLARSVPAEDDLGPVVDLVAPHNPAQNGVPSALTIDPHRNLLVARITEQDEEEASLLTFCHNRTGEVWVEFLVPLPRINGLAYHPDSGRLFALSGAGHSKSPSAEPQNQGGLFEIVATRHRGKPAVAANRIMDLDHPSSMVFDESGTLYVTQWGGADETDDPATSGTLLRLELEL